MSLPIINSYMIFQVRHPHLLIKSNIGKGKGKAIPLQALTGPDGSKRLMLPDFKTIGT
jgi:hypothetical protein